MAEAKTVKKTTKKAVETTEEMVEKAPAKKTAPKAESHSAKAPRDKEGEGFAVIETGGKQYGVTTGDSFKIEKLIEGDKEFKVGDSVVFDKVLLVNDTVGMPYVAGSKVTATISEIGRNQKVTVIKYKQKSRYFKKNGHRQPFFKVVINTIS